MFLIIPHYFLIFCFHCLNRVWRDDDINNNKYNERPSTAYFNINKLFISLYEKKV